MRYLPRILAVLVVLAGVIVGHTVLPYHFSSQRALHVESLTEDLAMETTGEFHGETFQIPYLQTSSLFPKVLGSTSADKRIEVDLASQRLYAFENGKKVFDFLISSGKWGRTPTGTFRIWIKLRSTKMEGGNKAMGTYYYLPGVPYTMFFANDEVPTWRGFGIHGTYWHENFGQPMSHGCINMKTEEAEKIFYWAQPDLSGKSSIKSSDNNPGTPVIIYGTAPAT